ncbi:hypothetical protein CTAYLR_004773 [Chrysophaeum taylorii]|uniref:Uncharacterized protein n=1 Tax=Chrysophaeum taylorii TaxID=2483200 RepID=A0AAD7XRF7_9STRA|nr:hypothetical protein CTAYLR_006437 [Chrysophaeum taylorii]KAJ8613136.1 hypothetical protein CTAYLR_004773 [Chrysophaeum taylorii]
MTAPNATEPAAAMVCATGPSDVQQNLLIVLTVSNITLLFLVGLLARRLEALHVKLSRYIKSSRSTSQKSLATATATRVETTPSRPPSPDVTRELVTGHVQMLRTTLSNQSLRSSLSADDFASLQCMLGEEDGITM